MAQFHKRLAEIRKIKGLKQSDLANIINMRAAGISKYESGISQPNLDTLKQIAKIFDVSTDYLLGVSDVPTRANNGDISLNDDEIALIEAYKKLPRDYQFEIKGYINGILKSSGVSP